MVTLIDLHKLLKIQEFSIHYPLQKIIKGYRFAKTLLAICLIEDVIHLNLDTDITLRPPVLKMQQPKPFLKVALNYQSTIVQLLKKEHIMNIYE